MRCRLGVYLSTLAANSRWVLFDPRASKSRTHSCSPGLVCGGQRRGISPTLRSPRAQNFVEGALIRLLLLLFLFRPSGKHCLARDLRLALRRKHCFSSSHQPPSFPHATAEEFLPFGAVMNREFALRHSWFLRRLAGVPATVIFAGDPQCSWLWSLSPSTSGWGG